jgi:hypothetical protein
MHGCSSRCDRLVRLLGATALISRRAEWLEKAICIDEVLLLN